MGFGLLFVGYIMTVFNVPMLGLIGTLIRMGGCAVMLCGALKLKHYCKAFGLTFIGASVMAIMTAVLLFVDIDGFLFENLISNKRLVTDFGANVIGYVDQGSTFVFNSLLLWGIYRIAKDTEIKSIEIGAVRNYILVCVYHAVYLISFLPISAIQSASYEFALITWILNLAWMILDLWLLFVCYSRICDEDDVDMSKRTVSIPGFNGFIDAFEAKAKKAKEEDELYRQEKRRIREEKKRKK